MMRAPLRYVPLPAVLLLAACGFTPLYGLTFSGQADILRRMAQVEIATPRSGVGDALRTHLARILHTREPTRGPYRLTIRLSSTERDFLIRPDAQVTRRSVALRADYRLDLNKNPKDEALWQGQHTTFASYNRVESEFENLAARDDARNRVVRKMAEEIRLRLAIFLRSRPENAE